MLVLWSAFWRVIPFDFRPLWLEFIHLYEMGITMSELRERMSRDLKLAGLAKGTRKLYLRAVRQLAEYYMIPPDRLDERQVEEFLLYVRDDLEIARGTFEPLLAGLKFFYVNTLGYGWPLLSQKKFASRASTDCPTFAATRIAAA